MRVGLLALLFVVPALFRPTTMPAQTLRLLGETIVVDQAGSEVGAAAYRPAALDRVWLHVSLTERTLTVHRGDAVLHRFPVGVGTGARLARRNGEGWTFSTPEGVFTIGRKKEAPRWYAPDWHYVERSMPVPPAYSEERYFDGVLGDYAVYLSDEIAIHGTRDTDSVGRAASHGCLRMTNDDVEVVFELVEVGTKVVVTP